MRFETLLLVSMTLLLAELVVYSAIPLNFRLRYRRRFWPLAGFVILLLYILERR